MKCDACGNEDYLLLTRQNPKGEIGIFHCEKCTGSSIETREEAILEAISGVSSITFTEAESDDNNDHND